MLNIEKVKLRPEKEIRSSWSNKEEVVVSVLCATFNHESYIEDAINGFLIQKTNFRFEVIIHDDASTDSTAEILNKYAKLYPKIIKPIIQAVNQYSKGGFKPAAYMKKYSSGKYIALCEGDDCWISSDKLQKQYVALESNPKINLCIHDAFIVDRNDTPSNSHFPFRPSNEYIIPFREVLSTSGQFSPTASMFIKRHIFNNLPDFYYQAPVGDFFLEVFSGRNGVYYLPQKKSIYRIETDGAWSATVLKDTDLEIIYQNAMLSSICNLKYFLNKNEYSFVKYKKQHIFYILSQLYIRKKKRLESLRCFIYSLYGAVYLKRNINYIRDWFSIKPK